MSGRGPEEYSPLPGRAPHKGVKVTPWTKWALGPLPIVLITPGKVVALRKWHLAPASKRRLDTGEGADDPGQKRPERCGFPHQRKTISSLRKSQGAPPAAPQSLRARGPPCAAAITPAIAGGPGESPQRAMHRPRHPDP